MGLKGIATTLFVFIGAILMTYISVWIIMLDSQWHFGQRMAQAASITSLGYLSTFWGNLGLDFPTAAVLTLGMNMTEVEHSLFGLSPSSYFLWFMLWFFVFLIVGGILGALFEKTDMDPLRTIGFGAFIIGGSLVSMYIAIYIVVIDAQWHLRSQGAIDLLIGMFQPDLFYDLLGFLILGNWEFFEHSVGQSASSYVFWFIGFIVVYIIVSGVLVWISKGSYITR
ncbi:MAG: hypothetical protein ACTSRG_04325 [Candidatus Helarchaeota archaeon]